MPETFNVPMVGQVKKPYVYAGVGITVIAGVWYWRKRQTERGAGTTTPIDPATGYPYGSVEDEQALAAQQGSAPPSDYTGAVSPSTTSVTGSFTSNSQWAQYVEDYLVNTVGHSGTVVAAAIGKYLTGQEVTTDQSQIVNEAIAFGGYPPVTGPNGYPPSIRHAAGPPAGSEPKPGAFQIHVKDRTRTTITVAYKSNHATKYHLEIRHGGSVVHKLTTTDLQHKFTNLHPNTRYHIVVTAENKAGHHTEDTYERTKS